ncbi:hypothetical protein ABPG72_007103 [Tetrahymena utriculariae]
MSEVLIGKNFKLTKKLGSGGFGQIYLGVNTKSNLEVAIKLEKNNSACPQLQYEAQFYKRLLKDVSVLNNRGLPHVYYTAREGDFTFMVMDRLGSSLEDLFQKCGRKLSLKTVLMIGMQMVERIQFIHSKDVLHRDIKPDNFLMGRGRNAHIVYIVDFGLAKKLVTRNGSHIPYKENKNFTGTARYASLTTHIGIEQGRRDDLEGMMYVLLYFLLGSLPWMGVRSNTKKEKYDKIMEKKMTLSINEVFNDLPKEFVELFKYIRNLEFEEIPDYDYIKRKFEQVFAREGYELDYQYDWICNLNTNNADEEKNSS